MKSTKDLFGLFIALCFLVTLANAEDVASAGGLRFDGVYQAHPGGGRQSLYIRFYPDGHVVVMSFARDPDEVAHYIGREIEELPQGSFAVKSGTISFTTKAARGEIDYSGILEDGSIQFHMHSRINGFSGDERFQFVPVKFEIDREAFERMKRS
jgi:hypothetical protein